MAKKSSPTSFAAKFGAKTAATEEEALRAPQPSTPSTPPAGEVLKNLHVRVDLDTWIKLRNYANVHGRTVQNLLESYIDSLVNPGKTN